VVRVHAVVEQSEPAQITPPPGRGWGLTEVKGPQLVVKGL